MKIKIIQYKHSDGTVGEEQHQFFCPGCGYTHSFSLAIHTFNGDMDRPTLSPSLLQNFTRDRICHSLITDGYIRYLNDCWHKLKGQTVELPDEKNWNKH